MDIKNIKIDDYQIQEAKTDSLGQMLGKPETQEQEKEAKNNLGFDLDSAQVNGFSNLKSEIKAASNLSRQDYLEKLKAQVADGSFDPASSAIAEAMMSDEGYIDMLFS